MRYIRIFLIAFIFMPFAARAASNDFMLAAQLLSAAKNANIQQVQQLVNNGANVNFVDSTGLSLVCTALMNKDYRAAQILQMYGADASRCDQQIKQYNSRTKTQESGGLFGGLSSAQNLLLAAAGAAVVIGGVLWLSGVFDPDGGGSSGASGSRPNGGGSDSGNGNGTATAWFDPLPYGPAMPNANSESANLASNVNAYSPAKPADDVYDPFYANFQAMTAGTSTSPSQNYLLMMKGYYALARGYLGQQTLRASGTHTPIDISGIYNHDIPTKQVMGGIPVNVALITDNGINAADGTSLQNVYLSWSTKDSLTGVNEGSSGTVSSKYYNNNVTYNSGQSDWDDAFSSTEAASVNGATFDLSGAGTAINNVTASDYDNMLAKVVGGYTSSTNGDFVGFMPNGQMTIFRTGGGWKYVSPTETVTGTLSSSDDMPTVGDTITITDTTYTLSTVNDAGTQFTASVSGSDGVTANGWVSGDKLYLDTNGDGRIDQVFSISGTTLTQTLQGVAADYMNYAALKAAASLMTSSGASSDARRAAPSILANASVIDPLRDRFGAENRAATVGDILSAIGASNATVDTVKNQFSSYINEFYDNTPDDSTYNPSSDSTAFFNGLGSTYNPLVVFSTGSYETDSSYSGKVLEATFENAAPLVYQNLEHLFMSVVAVGLSGSGTNDAANGNIYGYTPSGKYGLSKWGEGTGDDTAYFRARKCGVAGRGGRGSDSNDIDPWCFAAAGITDELAVSAAAGAAGAVYSAFGGENGYLSNKELFVLLALTADGAYLKTDASGNNFTKDGLISYLQSMFELPAEDQYRVEVLGEDYLTVFKEVYGYGLINLARATTPGTTVYYFSGNNIVSANGNAYAKAAAATKFRSSAAFNPRMSSISAPFFDVLESFDGDMSLPRVWRNEFTLGTTSARGLYMGDTLGELKTVNASAPRTQIGAIGFSMSGSAKPYNDNLGGLDMMSVDYAYGDWNFSGAYQRYFTDGRSRFDGMANPILALATGAVVTDAEYRMGRMGFGARAFSGVISDEGILENDPTIAAQYMPAQLGLIRGGESHVSWHGDRFGFKTALGNAAETDTLLGAQTGGLLNLGAGDTVYVDTELRYAPTANLAFTLRGTFARTTSNADGDFILGLTDVDSDAYAFGMDAGNFSFTVARPLGVRRGTMRYAYADYRVEEDEDGNFNLNVVDSRIEDVNLAPEKRELRFTGTYRHNFGAFTDGALGFIYRVNPNNTDEFGNESIFMLKLTHRVGI